MVVHDSKTDTHKLEEDGLRFVRNLIDGWSPSSVSVCGKTLVRLHAAMPSRLSAGSSSAPLVAAEEGGGLRSSF